VACLDQSATASTIDLRWIANPLGQDQNRKETYTGEVIPLSLQFQATSPGLIAEGRIKFFLGFERGPDSEKIVLNLAVVIGVCMIR